jgi:hypothetical protein
MVADIFFHNRQEWIYALDIVFVVLALLPRRFSVRLCTTGLMPGWVGWVGWSFCPLARPQAGMDFMISTIGLALETECIWDS